MNDKEWNNRLMAEYAKGYEEGKKARENITAEIEYKLSEKCNALADKNEQLRKELDSMESEFARMRAQLDIVYLIFGGK